jgi:hypothetical protein
MPPHTCARAHTLPGSWHSAAWLALALVKHRADRRKPRGKTSSCEGQGRGHDNIGTRQHSFVKHRHHPSGAATGGKHRSTRPSD